MPDPADSRLLRFLRDLARARRDRAGPGTEPQVYWLADLPGDVRVNDDAGPGETLFAVPAGPWHGPLSELAARGGAAELATGLLAWRPAEGPAVRGHLLTTPVRVVADARSGRLDVVLDGPTRLRDRELLAGLPGFRPARTDWVWDAVRDGQGVGLRASASDVLRKWCAVAFRDQTVAFREDWAAPAGPPPSVPLLRLAPALVVRPGTLADHYAGLAAERETPPGVAAFLEPGARSPVLHVPERTPQVVADLLAGLLARGLRVLVATGADLGDALHPRVAVLCDPGAFPLRGEPEPVDALVRREGEAAQVVAELKERLRLTEDTGDCDLGPGYRGDRAALARRIAAEADRFDWLPPRPDLPTTPPLTAAEAAELVRLMADTGEDRTRHRDVDPRALPGAPYVRTLIEAEAAAAAEAERNETDLSRRLRRCDVALLARLDVRATTVRSALRDLGLAGHPGGWDDADHAARAFTDALAHRRPAVWARVAELAPQAEWAERAMASLGDRHVEIPPDEPHLRHLVASAQELRAYLLGGGTLKRGPLRPTVQRNAETLLTSVTVNGEPPTTPERLEAVRTHLMVRMACQELQYVWEAAGVSFPADVPLPDRVTRFARAHARLARVRDVLPAIEETTELLREAGLNIPLTHPLQWHAYTAALENVLLAQGVSRAAADLAALRDSIGATPDDPPELHRALAAVEARDAEAYGDALIDLAEARRTRAAQLRRADHLERLAAVHPELTDALTVPSPEWPSRAEHWDEAWAWAHAAGRLAAMSRSPTEAHLRRALAEAESRHRDLVAARAWNAHLEKAMSPARLVPLWRVPETVAPGETFDVVIVDGDEDTGAEALFLLWLAPRLILVGPESTDLPSPDTPVPADALPADLRGVVTPTTSLFTLLNARFTPPDRPAPANAEPVNVPRQRTAPEPAAPRHAEAERPARKHAFPGRVEHPAPRHTTRDHPDTEPERSPRKHTAPRRLPPEQPTPDHPNPERNTPAPPNPRPTTPERPTSERATPERAAPERGVPERG
ncbi:hypothetical protein, partial [Actinomadura kijaniata]|uniref:hypothetical protein n=1 Tax=Actinomadura kijaniata TaxID=46161 RepID=UPI00083796FE